MADPEPAIERVGLAEMIEALRLELELARTQGKGRAIGIGVERAELELKVQLGRSSKVGGGIKFWVVTAEGSAERSDETTHSFKLTLLPVDAATRQQLEVASESADAVDFTG